MYIICAAENVSKVGFWHFSEMAYIILQNYLN